MQVVIRQLPKSAVELTIELSTDELQPHLTRAAETLSREHPLPGFRPGKVPVEIAKTRYGAMALLEEATEQAVRDAYVNTVREQDLKTVGSPRLEVKTLAPDNPVRFTATVAVLPDIQLPDFATITAHRRPVNVTTEDVNRALDDLRKVQPNEALVDRPVEVADKVVIDLDLKRDKIPLEGGQARDHHIYLTESYYLPEVKKRLVGMAKGETKTFPLEFPKDYYQKHLAGTTVDCSVTVKDAYSVELPELNDVFAQRLGQRDLAALRDLVERNITEETQRKATDVEEIELLDAIVAASRIGDLPDLLVTGEAQRMVDELERGVAQQGLEFPAYLQKIGKTRDQLLLDFAPEAVRRVKVALVTRSIAEAQTQATAVTEADVEAEIQRQLDRYRDTSEFQNRIRSEEARDYIRATLRNRKVLQWLRERVQWT